MQLSGAGQSLLLLDRPAAACALFALRDPRLRAGVSPDTLWLSSSTSMLAQHDQHVVGQRVNVRAAQCPGFYVTLRVACPRHRLCWRGCCHTSRLRMPARSVPGSTPVGHCHTAGLCWGCPARRLRPATAWRGRRAGIRCMRGVFTCAPRAVSPPERVTCRPPNCAPPDWMCWIARPCSPVTKAVPRRCWCRPVLCVGLLGSLEVWWLARAGVVHLTLIGPDTLEAANVGRHVLGAFDRGRTKVDALR